MAPPATARPAAAALAAAVVAAQLFDATVGRQLLPTIAWVPQGWATGPAIWLLAHTARHSQPASRTTSRSVTVGLVAIGLIAACVTDQPTTLWASHALAAATEEAVYRIAVPVLTIRWLHVRPTTAAIAATVIFAIQPGHLAQGQLAVAHIAMLGGLLLWAMWRTQTVWPAVAGHVALNVVARAHETGALAATATQAAVLGTVTMLVVLVAASDQHTRPHHATVPEPA